MKSAFAVTVGLVTVFLLPFVEAQDVAQTAVAFGAARWIGGAPETFEDPDLSAARWIRSADTNGCERTFDLKDRPDGFVEMAFSATDEYQIRINGSLTFRSEMKDVFARRMRYFEIAPYLKAGRNVIQVLPLLNPVNRKPLKDVTFFLHFRLADGTVIASGKNWTSCAEELGDVRTPAFARHIRTAIERVSPAFSRRFNVGKTVKSAILSITAPGFYEARLNGVRVGNKVLDPPPTDYSKRVLYSTYDLTQDIRQGENELNVVLGHGWYDVRSQAYWNFDCAKWTAAPAVIASLRLDYADGTHEEIVTDRSWRHVESPVGYDCIREGEVIGRRDPRGIDVGARTVRAAEVKGPPGRLEEARLPGSEIVARYAPKSIRAVKDGWIVEFPCNIAGWVRLRLRAQEKGRLITVRYDEKLSADGSPLPSAYPKRSIDDLLHSSSFRVTGTRDAVQQQDRYFCTGEDEEFYEPRFTYNGFTYVYIRGLRSAPSADDIVACEIRTAFRPTAKFSCSNDDFMKLCEIADRSFRGNYVNGMPTDCPHREKLGWTGDAAVSAHYGVTAYDMRTCYAKWLQDIVDCMNEEGEIPVIAPTGGWGFQWGTGPVWDSALGVISRYVMDAYGDASIATIVYPGLVRYVDYVEKRTAGSGHVDWGLGDWLSNGPYTSISYLSSVHYLFQLRTAVACADALGLKDESKKYTALTRRSRQRIRQDFMRSGGIWDNGTQTSQALALMAGLVEEGERAAVAAKLVETVTATTNHIAFGLVGLRYVFPALSEIGRADLAWKMIMNPEGFSLASYLKCGATTLSEDWDWVKAGSRNHHMHCDYATWAIEYLAGVREPKSGYATFLYAPCTIPGLDNAGVTLSTVHGTIRASWRRQDGKVEYRLEVPEGVTARVRISDGVEKTVGSGKHVFGD